MIPAASSADAPLRVMKEVSCSSCASSRSCHCFQPLSHSASGIRTVHFGFLDQETGKAGVIEMGMRQGEILQRAAAQQAAP